MTGRSPECVSLTDRSARIRLEIARALIGAPAYVVLAELDECLELDETVKLLPMLRALARQEGVGVLVTAANRALAHHVVDRVLVLDGGRIQIEGPSPGPVAA